MPIDPTTINTEEKKIVDISELKELMAQNLALTKEVHEMTHTIKRYTTFQKITSLVYFILIVAPLILGIIYLPPMLGGIMDQYQGLLGDGANASLQDIFKAGKGKIDLQNDTPGSGAIETRSAELK